MLDGALDKQPSKLNVALPVPTQVAQFVPVISSTTGASPFSRDTPGMCRDPALASICAMPTRGGLFHYHHSSPLGYKSGSLFEVNKQNTPQMVENRSCEQFIDPLNSATIHSN